MLRARARVRSRRGWRPRSPRDLPVPTIGIGAGAGCDGQVLVFHDVMGLTGAATPRFARRYAELAPVIEEAARAFAKDVKTGQFPSREQEALPARHTRRAATRFALVGACAR